MTEAIAITLIQGLISLLTLGITAITKKKVDSIQEIRMETTRRYLVDKFSQIENGVVMSEEQKIEIHKAYDAYTKGGGNSYIHTKYEKIVKENKL